jgi:hypothetical protein
MNKKYYRINLILNLIYACVILRCLVYGFGHANFIDGGVGGGDWDELVEWMLFICFIPAPLITNILCIRTCCKNTKSDRVFFKCLGFGVLGFFSPLATVALILLLN